MNNTEENKEIRQEFARAFDWTDIESGYGYSSSTRKVKTPTWAEIFVEIGRLLAESKIGNSNSDILNIIRNIQRNKNNVEI